MRRLALLFMLAFLTCDLSGLDSFLVHERCSVNETRPDNNCSPTCVRCLDCAQPIVSIPTVALVHVSEPQVIATPVAARAIQAPPHDIFHIPRPISLIA